MAQLSWQPMDLPSRGVLYLDPTTGESLLPSGKVELRKMTAQEESILLSQGSQGLDRIAKIVTNCVRVPTLAQNEQPPLVPDDFLLTDRMALLLALRALTFQTTHYTFTFRCQFCNQTAKATEDLADLPERNPETIAYAMLEAGKIDALADFTLAEPITVSLPDAGQDVDVRFLRGHDEAKIAKRSKRTRMASNDMGDQSYIYRLALQIVAVDGDSEWPSAKKEAFVRQLSGGDTARMRIAVDDVEPGLDMTVYPSCTACGADNELSLPFTAEFFRPTSLQS